MLLVVICIQRVIVTCCQALIEQNEALVCSCRELESQLTTCTAVTAENASLTGRVRELETELDTAKRAMATSDEDRIMALTLELEKERGKLAGALLIVLQVLF